MSMLILLDASPLGMVTNPAASEANADCARWLQSMLQQGMQVAIPEIADYEVRRELLRAAKDKGLHRLDELERQPPIGYLPITTEVMRRAAHYWAQARKQGRPTAPYEALDADVILAAQATVAAEQGNDEVVIATTNVKHLDMFVDARLWQDVG